MAARDERILRVRFGEGQFLGADDLVDEQSYRENAERRHRIGQHSWGIVSGLELASLGSAFSVMPGLAIDGYGRALLVTSAIRVEVDVTTGGERDVWLSLSSSSNRRDVTTVCLTPADTVDPRRPPGVQSTEVAYQPQSAVGDEPRPWPVYLGRVCWEKQVVSISEDNRVYTGLRGEAVEAPSGRARLQIGAESSSDSTRFAIATEQVAVAGGAALGDAEETSRLTTQLVVDAPGMCRCAGPPRCAATW